MHILPPSFLPSFILAEISLSCSSCSHEKQEGPPWHSSIIIVQGKGRNFEYEQFKLIASLYLPFIHARYFWRDYHGFCKHDKLFKNTMQFGKCDKEIGSLRAPKRLWYFRYLVQFKLVVSIKVSTVKPKLQILVFFTINHLSTKITDLVFRGGRWIQVLTNQEKKHWCSGNACGNVKCKQT